MSSEQTKHTLVKADYLTRKWKATYNGDNSMIYVITFDPT